MLVNKRDDKELFLTLNPFPRSVGAVYPPAKSTNVGHLTKLSQLAGWSVDGE